MNNSCINCKFFMPYPRKIKYPKGQCAKQYAYRISDGYKIHLSVFTPYEYICDMYEPAPQPVYVQDEQGEMYLIPPIVVNDLIAKGWKLVKPSVIEKEGDE